MSSELADSRRGSRQSTRCGGFPGRSVRAHGPASGDDDRRSHLLIECRSDRATPSSLETTGSYRCEQFSDRSPCDRILPVRRNLGERFQHEAAVTKTRVGDDEVAFIHDDVAVQDQVEIESARRTRVRALTTELSFDIKESVEKVAGRQRCVAGRGGVQKSRLIADTNGIGLAKSGYAELLQMWLEGGDRFTQQALAVTQVAAESDCDVNCDHVLLAEA